MEGLSQPALLDVAPKRRKSGLLFNPKEFKILSLRECPTPAEMLLCDTPENAAAYWREHVPGHPYFNRDVECFVVGDDVSYGHVGWNGTWEAHLEGDRRHETGGRREIASDLRRGGGPNRS